MSNVQISCAITAPPIILQADRVRRRIAASDSVATLVAEMAFGPTRRGDVAALAAVTSSRCAPGAGCR